MEFDVQTKQTKKTKLPKLQKHYCIVDLEEYYIT
jgi:hypothetical protein